MGAGEEVVQAVEKEGTAGKRSLCFPNSAICWVPLPEDVMPGRAGV